MSQINEEYFAIGPVTRLRRLVRERENLTSAKLDVVENTSLPTVRLIPRVLLSDFDPSVWEINGSQRLETSRGQVCGGPCFHVSAENPVASVSGEGRGRDLI